jgi:acylphosphatase
VQGVGYRAWCVEQATRLGLSGWVRNRRDGSVEALVHGPEPVVGELVDLCRTGPLFASVSSVDVEETALDTGLSGAFAQTATL